MNFEQYLVLEMLLFGAYGARSKRAEGARENFGSLGMLYVDFVAISAAPDQKKSRLRRRKLGSTCIYM